MVFSFFHLFAPGLFGVLLLFCFPDDGVSSQTVQTKTLQGQVVEKESGNPVEFAHVYISRSTAGTTTDGEGRFLFKTTLTGRQQLIFSFVGYHTLAVTVNLDDPRPVFNFRADLELNPVELGEIEISTSNAEWQRNYREFREQFIGTTEFANETEILNPWVLDFSRDPEESLEAAASRALEIENRALGYRIRADLTGFEWQAGGLTGFYTLQTKFEELEPAGRRESRAWQRNRRRAYEGSFEHFLASLYRDELRENDFEIVRMDTYETAFITELSEWEVRRSQMAENPGGRQTIPDNLMKGYKLNQPVDILYGRRSRYGDNRVRSRLVPLTNRNEFFVNAWGRLQDPLSLRLDGVWSQHRIGNMLPVDYEPE